MQDDPLETFASRLASDWLPAYCNDLKRQYATEGYKAKSNKVSTVDASAFLRALDSGIVVRGDRGGYRLPLGKTEEAIFWEGHTKTVPRSITLWIEPVITIAVVARLHFDLGWPVDCLALQSAKWEFDLTASLPANPSSEHIAAEVKKSEKELDALIEHMVALGAKPEVEEQSLKGATKNAYKKLKGLTSRRAPFFWAVGPGEVSHAFAVEYSAESTVAFTPVPSEMLTYPGSRPVSL